METFSVMSEFQSWSSSKRFAGRQEAGCAGGSAGGRGSLREAEVQNVSQLSQPPNLLVMYASTLLISCWFQGEGTELKRFKNMARKRRKKDLLLTFVLPQEVSRALEIIGLTSEFFMIKVQIALLSSCLCTEWPDVFVFRCLRSFRGIFMKQD